MISEKRKFNAVYRALKKLGINKELLFPEARLGDDITFDDLDWLLFMNQVESQLHREIEDERFLRARTVQQLVQAI